MTQAGNYAKEKTGCHIDTGVQSVQPFPKFGPLKNNLGLGLSELRKQLVQDSGPTFSYIVQTVKMNNDAIEFEQHGSGPNFQGDRLTLCTCKHQMRTRKTLVEWKGTWVAGFTGVQAYEKKNWLFYLAKIEQGYESHTDLWGKMSQKSRDAKAAHLNFLGDVFMPKEPFPDDNARFWPIRYRMPKIGTHTHRTVSDPDGWQTDIQYRHSISQLRPSLLAGDPQLTFMWDEPTIYLPGKHCRDYAKYKSIGELLRKLK